VLRAKEEESVAELGAACSIDDMSNCSVADLEEMYVAALWSYYEEGKPGVTDAQYDNLKEELNWQGSGFPTLRRDEIKFVQASIEAARGNAVMTDAEYDELKMKVKVNGKRADVTALLLYVKGQQMLEPEQYEALKDEMAKLGIDIGLKGAACTLSNTPEDLSTDIGTLLVMYGGLGALPFLGGSVLWKLADYFLTDGLPLASYFAFTGVFTAGFVVFISTIAELTGSTIVTGQCPCCESPVNAYFGADDAATKAERKCQVCGTTVTLDRDLMKLTLKDGPKFVQ